MKDRREEGEEGEEELSTLEAIAEQLERANNIFHKAITTVNNEERKELLEEALREYASVLPLLNPYRKDVWGKLVIRTVLDKIHAVEGWIEQEIARSVTSETDRDIDKVLTEARLLLQQQQID